MRTKPSPPLQGCKYHYYQNLTGSGTIDALTSGLCISMITAARHQPSRVALQDCTLCHECDLLVDMRALHEGSQAVCPRCRCILSKAYPHANVRILVFALTAMICLVMSLMFDFVALKVAGQVRNITLPETIATLFTLQEWTLSVFMGIIIVVLPLLFMGALG